MTAKPKKKVLDEKSRIAERLRNAREELKLTQQQVANKAGISRSAIVHYEQGNVIPGGPELIGLAKALKITPNVILSGKEGFFDSAAPEHVLATTVKDTYVRAAQVAICMQALEGEVAEALSALAIALVKARVSPSEYDEVARAIESAARISAGMAPEVEAMIDKKTNEGAFNELLKAPPKSRRSTKGKPVK